MRTIKTSTGSLLDRYIAKNTAIATTTFYTPGSSEMHRADIALATFREAVDRGYDVHVVDGGSPKEILDAMGRTGVHVYNEVDHPRGVLGPGRRQAVSKALDSGREGILWTEPEKTSFITQAHQAMGPVLNSDALYVQPGRLSLDSYPTSQQYAERLGNEYFAQLTGTELDMWFGPRAMSRDAAKKYFLTYDDEYGGKWDSTFIPMMRILHNAPSKVQSVPVNYKHPAKQRGVEEHNPSFTLKRLVQLENLMPALRDEWIKLKGNQQTHYL